MTSIEASSSERHFQVDHLKVGLRRRSLQGAATTLTAEAIKFVLNFGSIAVLGRIIAPDQFGIFAMVTGTLAFVSFIKDFGLSTAVQQRAEVNHQQLSTLFWLNVALAIALAGLVAAAAPGLAWFYGQPDVLWVCVAWSAVPLLDGLGMQHQSLMARQMQFGALAALELLALALSIAVGIAAAWRGANVWALLLMQVTRSAVYLAGVWILCGWRPSAPRRGTGVRPMIMFGGSLTASSLLDYVWRDFDKIVIGKVAGVGPLGLFSNAQRLMSLPMQQIMSPLGRVALPALSRVADAPDRYREAYIHAVSLLMRVMMPIIAISFFWADRLVPLALGDQWNDAVPFFQLLAIAAIPRTLSSVAGWLFVTRGEAGRQLKFRLATLWVSPALFIAGAIIGGAMGVAWACAISAWVLMPPWLFWAERSSGIGLRNMFMPAARPVIAAVGASAFVRFAIPMGDYLAIGLIATPVLYLALLCVAAGGLRPIREFEEHLGIILSKKKQA
jgi:O-antigen/teichoic acid export membrane protein